MYCTYKADTLSAAGLPALLCVTGHVLVSLSLSLSASVLHCGNIQHAFRTVFKLVVVYKYDTELHV